MTTQEILTIVALTLGGQTGLLSIAGHLGRKFVEIKLKEQQSRFDHELAKAHSLFSSRKQIFCEKQEEAIAHTYSLLWSCHIKLMALGRTNNLAEYEKEVSEYTTIQHEASLFFLSKCFYFTEPLFDPVQRLFLLYNEMATLYRRGHTMERGGAQYMIHVETLQKDKAEVESLLKHTRAIFYETLSADAE